MRNEIPVVKLKTLFGVVENYAVIGGNYYYFGDDSPTGSDDTWLRKYFAGYVLNAPTGHLKAMRNCIRYTPELIRSNFKIKRIPKPFIYRYVS